MEITVRKATATDIEPMTELLADLFSIEEDFTPNTEKQQKGLAMMVDGSEERMAFVAEADEEVLGMITGQLLVSTAEGGLTTLIEDLVVSPKMRGKGVGALLLAELEKWARGLGAVRLQLLADKDNGPAKGFYEKAGWTMTNLAVLRKTKSGSTRCPGMKDK